MWSLYSFTSLLLLITYSVKGSSYCMADCNSNGHQPSLYLQYCCNLSNRGKSFKIQDEMSHINYILCPSISPTSCPVLIFSSCSQLHEVYSTAPSGYYNITLSNGSQVEVYCDMEGSHCDGEGGWTRMAFVNMSEPGSSCPPGLVQYDNITNTSLCWITTYSSSNFWGCKSTIFSTYGLNYTKVCGQVRAYQYGYPRAFQCYIEEDACSDPQIWGITLTYSSNPRKHIWTYVGGQGEEGTGSRDCPCNNGNQYMNYTIPFVGNNYYCESGRDAGNYGYFLHFNDPLWDGRDCSGPEATCCTFPKMPWFVKTLNETVNDDIELSTCGYDYHRTTFWGTPLDLVELYIK